jgi:hypothetical protein
MASKLRRQAAGVLRSPAILIALEVTWLAKHWIASMIAFHGVMRQVAALPLLTETATAG